MKTEILIGMLNLLLSVKQISAAQIADRFDISTRTVFRYLDELSVSGIPLWHKRGRNGGICIPDTYKLYSNTFTKSELESVISAIKAFDSQIGSGVLKSALAKISAPLKSMPDGKYISGNIIFDCSNWGGGDYFKSKLKVLENAADKTLLLDIEYYDRHGNDTRRTVEPHLLIFKQGIWYLFAFCTLRGEFRFFKVTRIRNALTTERTFTRKDLSLLEIPFNAWYNDGTSVEVEFEIQKNALADVEEWLGIERIERKGIAYYTRVTLPDDNNLIHKIMSFGQGLKVISPARIIEKIKAYVKDLQDSYL